LASGHINSSLLNKPSNNYDMIFIRSVL